MVRLLLSASLVRLAASKEITFSFKQLVIGKTFCVCEAH